MSKHLTGSGLQGQRDWKQDVITTGVVEEMTAFEVADQLMVWRNTFRETSVNFDARLLKRAADLLEDLQHKVNDCDDSKHDMTIAYLLGVEDARKDRSRKSRPQITEDAAELLRNTETVSTYTPEMKSLAKYVRELESAIGIKS